MKRDQTGGVLCDFKRKRLVAVEDLGAGERE